MRTSVNLHSQLHELLSIKANFLYGMPLAQIRMHHLTPQLQHSKLEQLANKRRIRRHKSTNTLAQPLFHSCGNRDIRSVWSKNSRFPKRAGTSVEASVWRGELFPLSCPKAVGCHSERQFSFSNGDNGWGWGGVLCIVFYVCLLVLYLLYRNITSLLESAQYFFKC